MATGCADCMRRSSRHFCIRSREKQRGMEGCLGDCRGSGAEAWREGVYVMERVLPDNASPRAMEDAERDLSNTRRVKGACWGRSWI